MAETGPALSADDVVRLLGLQPHPEGGAFRETYRDAATDAHGRSVSTAIYFLLRAGERSRWHRVDAAEIWHHYAGAPLDLSIVDESGTRTVRLGTRLGDGEAPQAVVPPTAWQQARSLGDWTLVGCTVAPGFEFTRFEIAPEGFDPGRITRSDRTR